MIIGIDEVGRGCWAGPLLACAVKLDDTHTIEGLTDSKLISAKKRTLICRQIQEQAKQIGIGWVWPKEINKLGLTESVRLAMQRALSDIDLSGEEIIVDGHYNYLHDIPKTTALIKADVTIPAVSAASIIAKVARDTYMIKIAEKYPNYGFEKHVGYGTKLHIDALRKHGVLQIHRVNYKPIKKLLTL